VLCLHDWERSVRYGVGCHIAAYSYDGGDQMGSHTSLGGDWIRPAGLQSCCLNHHPRR
jgi:hypothetical protein